MKESKTKVSRDDVMMILHQMRHGRQDIHATNHVRDVIAARHRLEP
jgi:hypothetical protein